MYMCIYYVRVYINDNNVKKIKLLVAFVWCKSVALLFVCGYDYSYLIELLFSININILFPTENISTRDFFLATTNVILYYLYVYQIAKKNRRGESTDVSRVTTNMVPFLKYL